MEHRVPISTVPELRTDRLILRGLEGADFEDFARMWGDGRVAAMISGVPDTPQEAWMRLLRYIGHWTATGYGFWAVRDRESGALLGSAGFIDYKRVLSPDLEGVPEAGWALVPEAQGRGIATEAMRAALNWGDVHLPVARSFALFDPAHAASIRVAEKLGYGGGTLHRWRGSDALVMTREP